MSQSPGRHVGMTRPPHVAPVINRATSFGVSSLGDAIASYRKKKESDELNAHAEYILKGNAAAKIQWDQSKKSLKTAVLLDSAFLKLTKHTWLLEKAFEVGEKTVTKSMQILSDYGRYSAGGLKALRIEAVGDLRRNLTISRETSKEMIMFALANSKAKDAFTSTLSFFNKLVLTAGTGMSKLAQAGGNFADQWLLGTKTFLRLIRDISREFLPKKAADFISPAINSIIDLFKSNKEIDKDQAAKLRENAKNNRPWIFGRKPERRVIQEGRDWQNRMNGVDGNGGNQGGWANRKRRIEGKIRRERDEANQANPNNWIGGKLPGRPDQGGLGKPANGLFGKKITTIEERDAAFNALEKRSAELGTARKNLMRRQAQIMKGGIENKAEFNEMQDIEEEGSRIENEVDRIQKEELRPEFMFDWEPPKTVNHLPQNPNFNMTIPRKIRAGIV